MAILAARSRRPIAGSSRTLIASWPSIARSSHRACMSQSGKTAPAWRRCWRKPQYLNAPEVVIEQVLTGRYADGLGAIKEDPGRVDYQPFPHYAAAVWLMVQLRRWNMLKEDIDYKKLAEQVMLTADAGEDHARSGRNAARQAASARK